MLGVRGVLERPILDERLPEQVFIIGGNSHLLSRFCRVVLGAKLELGWATSWVAPHPNTFGTKKKCNELCLTNKLKRSLV